MGKKRAEESVQRAIVLDAGGMIAFERANERMAALIDHAAKIQATVVVPASALAQTWRGGPRSTRLAHLIANSEGDPLDETRAKEVGERLGSRAKTDIADAHAVSCAVDRRAALLTSDAEDMTMLKEPHEDLLIVSV